jgi:formylglycine-generating enzyme required for sulfatase activity
LPLEDEWEMAAGGKDDDRYPWEGPPLPAGEGQGVRASRDTILHYANTLESNLGRTTPVCMYPAGASHPHGVMDMAGNVWEWQANNHSEEYQYPALRGGTCFDDLVNARVANRFRYSPNGWAGNVGFRVVAAPVSR